MASRIFGYVADAAEGFAPNTLDRMAARFGAAASRVAAGPAAFGVVGRNFGAVARRGAQLCAIDGAFYGDAYLPAAANDAERFLLLLETHAIDAALARLNGDFAIAFWDGTALHLIRDRLGVRPLYAAKLPGGWAFASQPRALLGLPGADSAPDPGFMARFGASHYRTIDDEPTRSPYRAIAQIPAATIARLQPGRAPTQTRWWTLGDPGDSNRSEASLAEEYRALLLDAVAIRLRRAANAAFSLSGGMDSASILACAVEAAGHGLPAFSSVYDDKTFDESDEIKPMLERHTAPWTPVRSGDSIDLPAEIRAAILDHDEPLATATWLAHRHLIADVAARGHDVLFGGLGGDELNAGEFEYFAMHFADLCAAGEDAFLAQEIALWAHHHDHPIWRKDAAKAQADMARLTDPSVPGRVRADRGRIEKYAAALLPVFFDLRSYEPPMEHPFATCLKNRTWQDLSRETAPCCLRAEDRHGAAFGMRQIDPFFDHRLVAFMFAVPGKLKIRDGVTKRLLREAMRGLLPEETRTRVKKMGWNAPAHVWFSGPGLVPIRDMVAGRAFRERGLWNVAEVERLIDEHETIVREGSRRETHMMFLWQLTNLETWLAAIPQIAAGPATAAGR
jgi:asparagine synthase (glutamine-hydrolysing)